MSCEKCGSEEAEDESLSGGVCEKCGHIFTSSGTVTGDLPEGESDRIAKLLGAEYRGTSKAMSGWFGAQQSILDHQALKKKDGG